jgi:branched-chain amino acid transport system substrate-binding protein
MAQRKILLLASILLCVSVGINPAMAQKKYDPGASDTEIRIGNIMPYSGPLSAYALIGRTQAAFFKKLNDEGGINGRKINFISYDDAFSPPKKDDPAIKEWAVSRKATRPLPSASMAMRPPRPWSRCSSNAATS